MLIDRLVASGHLQRTPHPTDRRRISLQPTTSAHQGVRAAISPLIASITNIIEELDERDANVVMEFLTQLTTALEQYTPATRPRDPGQRPL